MMWRRSSRWWKVVGFVVLCRCRVSVSSLICVTERNWLNLRFPLVQSQICEIARQNHFSLFKEGTQVRGNSSSTMASVALDFRRTSASDAFATSKVIPCTSRLIPHRACRSPLLLVHFQGSVGPFTLPPSASRRHFAFATIFTCCACDQECSQQDGEARMHKWEHRHITDELQLGPSLLLVNLQGMSLDPLHSNFRRTVFSDSQRLPC